jgi:diaminohydroxyphosphoribosylaminopyrimidine deaminase/5-amino-6-(5-phosphoribosylamino)uracil reductase
MVRALQLAARGLYTTDPNPRVGCVLVRDGQIFGEGWHRARGGPHAEVEALAKAGELAAGATVYVTLEPCCHHGKTPPCTEALIAAGVGRVVAAMEDPNPRVGGRGLAMLMAAGITTECGLLARAAEELNVGFCSRMRSGKPLLRSKLAMSLDGRTALASGASRWITGEAARRDVHRWRARSSAIVTGIGTALADDPSLTARLDDDEEVLQPVRVVLDSRLRLPVDARLLALPGRTVVLTVADDVERIRALTDGGAEVRVLEPDAGSGRVGLATLGRCLGELEFNEVWFEAGPTLNGALLQSGLIDEWIIYMAPCVLGDAARGLFNLGVLESMEQRPELQLVESRQVGRDLRLRLTRAGSVD